MTEYTKEALEVVGEAMARVEELLSRVVDSYGEAKPAIHHLLSSGGKRVRPLLAILGAASVSGGGIPDTIIPVAAASELIHTASLLHDDVIDESDLRRGQPTARLVYSNAISVLAGDHCLASAVKLIMSAGSNEVLQHSLNMIQDLTTGELIQLDVQGRLDIPVSLYEDICYRKTAALFVWAAQSGALLAGGDAVEVDALEVMGRSMGIAFQIADDLLDFTAEEEELGKNLMDDVKDGRLTLPLIVALEGNETLRQLLSKTYKNPHAVTEDTMSQIRSMVLESGAVDVVRERVSSLTHDAICAIHQLPDNSYRQMILDRVEALAGRNK